MDSISHRERWVVLWPGPLRVDFEDTIRESNAILMIPVLSRVQKLILRIAPFDVHPVMYQCYSRSSLCWSSYVVVPVSTTT